MPNGERTDLYEYERRIRVLLLEAHEDDWVLERLAEMAVRNARVTLMNRELATTQPLES